MLTENQLKALPEPIWRNFQRLESDIIERICTRIRQVGELTATDAHMLDELQRIGYDLAAIQREIASTLDISTRQVYDIFARASELEYNGARANFELSGRAWVPFAENEQVQLLVESYARAAAQDLRNLSRTTGFVNARNAQGVLLKRGAFQTLGEYYQSVIDYAALQVRTGQQTFDQAMRATIRDMADRGYQSVDYESGYRRRLDTAVRANLMDAQARLSMAQAELVGQQFGANGYEITWHSGARPSHVWIGGLQVSVEEFERSVRPVMEEPNCYHRKHPIILGISPPVYTRDELAALNARDAEPHQFGGKSYNAYEAQKQQRDYETQIRAQKDRAIAFGKSGDAEAAAIARGRAATLQAEYARFSTAMGIQVKPARTSVSGYRGGRTSALPDLSTLPKLVKSPPVTMQHTVGSTTMRGVVPQGAEAHGVVVMAGHGTSTQLRHAQQLVESYGGEKLLWEKKSGIVYTDHFKYEVHWYEYQGRQYEPKMKRDPTPRKE